jgi:hypothetical protein
MLICVSLFVPFIGFGILLARLRFVVFSPKLLLRAANSEEALQWVRVLQNLQKKSAS